jgi:hypothetical protein
MDDSWHIWIISFLVIFGVSGITILILYLQQQAQKRAWEEIASQFGLALNPGRFLLSYPVVTGMLRGHKMVLDTFMRGARKHRSTYTRIVITVDNPADLRLALSGETIFSKVGKSLGIQDIQMGDEEIDHRFMIKGQPEEGVRRLLTSAAVRQRLLAAPWVNLELEGKSIRYERQGVEKNSERLHSLIELLSELAAAVDAAR